MFLYKKIMLFVFFFILAAKVSAQSVGGIASGANTYCDTFNSGFISITGYVGNVTTWQYSTNGGTTWTNNSNTFSSQSYFNLKQTTCYRAVVKNGSFPSDTSTIACVTVYLPSVGGTITGGGSFCGSSGTGTLSLTGSTGNVLKWQSSTNSGTTWIDITNTTTSLAYSNITQNTMYRAIVQNSTFCLRDTSSIASFTINPITVSGSLNSATSNTVCYFTNTNTLTLNGNVGNILNWLSSTNNGVNWNAISNITNTLVTSGLIQTTLFKAVVQSPSCSIDSTASLKITVLSQNTVNAGTDTTISIGQSVTLNGSGIGTVLWLPLSSGLTNNGILNPIATPTITTNYILTITDGNSCVSSDSVLITVLPVVFDGMISSVFTPNGDGINDNWYIENINYYPDNEVSVYNIYGNTVFSQKGYKNDWQGTYNNVSLPDGTYFYVIKIGESGNILKGSLDILRNK